MSPRRNIEDRITDVILAVLYLTAASYAMVICGLLLTGGLR